MSNQTTAKQQIPQSHLLPQQKNQRYGSVNNELDVKKRKYIIDMRKAICDENIILQDGSLNRKYFNVKKGQYWSQKENDNLMKGVKELGPLAFKQIKKKYFENWSETEIRLRICRLFKVYDLSVYANRKFKSTEEILEEAKKNREEGKKAAKIVGGVFYNPPVEKEENFLFSKAASSSFNKSKGKQ